MDEFTTSHPLQVQTTDFGDYRTLSAYWQSIRDGHIHDMKATKSNRNFHASELNIFRAWLILPCPGSSEFGNYTGASLRVKVEPEKKHPHVSSSPTENPVSMRAKEFHADVKSSSPSLETCTVLKIPPEVNRQMHGDPASNKLAPLS